MKKKYYLIRAMSQAQDDFDIFFNNNVVAIGWSEVDFTQFREGELLVAKVEEVYYENGDTSPQVVGKKKNEVRRFKGINSGDRIIIPSSGAICLAEAESCELFSKQVFDQDLSNQRKVTYHRNQNGDVIFIPRDKLSEKLQRRMRVRGTAIADLWEFGEEIEGLFAGEDFESSFNKKRIAITEVFKSNLLEKIQSGETNLESGGYGLEKLVQELLIIDGYDAAILPKQKFSGFADADLEAIKEDFLLTKKLFVQVKHHSGVTGTWGAEQLVEIMNSDKDFFSEYKLVLVTSANPSDELVKLCETKELLLVDGNELVEWIFKSLKNLKYETKKRLGISDIPTLINLYA